MRPSRAGPLAPALAAALAAWGCTPDEGTVPEGGYGEDDDLTLDDDAGPDDDAADDDITPDDDTGLDDDSAPPDDDDSAPPDDDATPPPDDDATPPDDDTASTGDDDATPPPDDDATPPDDDTASTGDDDATPPPDDDATPPPDDDTASTGDDDATPPPDDDTIPPPDDDATPPDPLAESCHPWDPIDVIGATWEYAVSRELPEAGMQSWEEVQVATGEGTFAAHPEEPDGWRIETTAVLYEESVDATLWKACGTVDPSGTLSGGQVAYGADVYYDTYAAAVTTDPGFRYLPAPPQVAVGASWTTEFHQDWAGYYATDVVANLEIVALAEPISVGATTLQAVHVAGTYRESVDEWFGDSWEGTIDLWLAKGIGLVREVRVRTGEGWPFPDPDEVVLEIDLTGYGGPLHPLP